MSEVRVGETLPPTGAFIDAIDDRFSEGQPRRHRPGEGLGEEELFLDGDPAAIGLPDAPATICLVRPKPNDISKKKPQLYPEPRGHRLYIYQTLPATDTEPPYHTQTLYFIPEDQGAEIIWEWFSYSDARPSVPVTLRLKDEHGLNHEPILQIPRSRGRGYKSPIDNPEHVDRIVRFIRDCSLAEAPTR